MNTINYLLFENPWPVMVLLGLAGVVCIVMARRGRPGCRFGAAAMLIAAAGLSFLSQMIVTDQESIRNELHGLARQVSAGHYDDLEKLLAENVIVHTGADGEGVPWPNRRARLRIKRGMDAVAATGVELSDLEIDVSDNTATATFTATLLTSEGAMPATQWSVALERITSDAGPSKLWTITEVWAPGIAGGF